MTTTTPTKEEFYVRRLFNDDVPVFVDATRYARQGLAYPLSAKKTLKATCGVRTDDQVVAFSLRSYTVKQAEREVETVETTVDGRLMTQNQLPLRMPRRTLYELNETAREVSPLLGDEVIVDLDGSFYVLTLTRTVKASELNLTATLTKEEAGYVRTEVTDPDVQFELPIAGIRLRVFLRSPIRERILAYAFGGYLPRRPGESETVTRATSLAVNYLLGLSTFRLLSGLDTVEVPHLSPGADVRPRTPDERVTFDVPVLLFTGDNQPAARGHVTAEIGLDQIDPETGRLQVLLSDGTNLEWNPAVAGTVRFADYERVLTEAIAGVLDSVLGADLVREVTYDVMLSEIQPETVANLRTVTAGFPGLAANTTKAEVRPSAPVPGISAA